MPPVLQDDLLMLRQSEVIYQMSSHIQSISDSCHVNVSHKSFAVTTGAPFFRTYPVRTCFSERYSYDHSTREHTNVLYPEP